MGFSVVFLLVLLKNRDIVGAVLDASIACVIMAFVFRQLYLYTISLEKRAKENRAVDTPRPTKNQGDSRYESLTDNQAES